jgi:hypothetical protein
MKRRRILHVVAYLPLVVLAVSAIATMTQVGCSAGNSGGYGGYGSGGYGSGGYGSGSYGGLTP